MSRFRKMTGAEDATITEEVPVAALAVANVEVPVAAVSAATEVQHQEAAVSAQEKKVGLAAEANQEVRQQADPRLNVRPEDQTPLELLFLTVHQGVPKDHRMLQEKEDRERANIYLLIF